jgi:carbonic anhydrase
MKVPGSNWQVGGAVLLTLALASWPGEVMPQAAEDPSAPAASIARLKTGNARFVSNPESALPISTAQRSALATGQTPFAAVLSCADSRVPPEVVFHTGLGDLFVVRAAGHVADRSVLASLEYAAEHLHVPVVVVMGHESCGAVKAAVETPASKSLGPNLDYMLKAIRPAVVATASAGDTVRIRAAILKNVEESINDLLTESSILRHLAESGALGFVGAYYELSSGRAHFSEPATVGPMTAQSSTRASAHGAH